MELPLGWGSIQESHFAAMCLLHGTGPIKHHSSHNTHVSTSMHKRTSVRPGLTCRKRLRAINMPAQIYTQDQTPHKNRVIQIAQQSNVLSRVKLHILVTLELTGSGQQQGRTCHGELIGVDEVKSLCHGNEHLIIDPPRHTLQQTCSLSNKGGILSGTQSAAKKRTERTKREVPAHLFVHPFCDRLVILLFHIPLAKLRGTTRIRSNHLFTPFTKGNIQSHAHPHRSSLHSGEPI